jgi:hypothetical protein
VAGAPNQVKNKKTEESERTKARENSPQLFPLLRRGWGEVLEEEDFDENETALLSRGESECPA